jgi:hypothetical protein
MQPDCLHSTSRARPLCKPLSTSSHQLSKVAANCCQSCAAGLPSRSLKDPSMGQHRTGQRLARRPTPATPVIPGGRAMLRAVRAARRRGFATPKSRTGCCIVGMDPTAPLKIRIRKPGGRTRSRLFRDHAGSPSPATRCDRPHCRNCLIRAFATSRRASLRQSGQNGELGPRGCANSVPQVSHTLVERRVDRCVRRVGLDAANSCGERCWWAVSKPPRLPTPAAPSGLLTACCAAGSHMPIGAVSR